MKSIEECLDMILGDLVKNWDKPNTERDDLNGKGLLKQFELSDYFQKDEFFKRLIDRLIKDGYAEFNRGKQSWVTDFISDLQWYEKDTLITVEGYYFITKENGGYKKELEAKNNAEEMADKKYSGLIRGTWFVGFGAFALVVWEMAKTFLIEHHSHCH